MYDCFVFFIQLFEDFNRSGTVFYIHPSLPLAMGGVGGVTFAHNHSSLPLARGGVGMGESSTPTSQVNLFIYSFFKIKVFRSFSPVLAVIVVWLFNHFLCLAVWAWSEPRSRL